MQTDERDDSAYLFGQIGVAIAIGVYAKPGWGFYVALAALCFAITNVAFRSRKFQNYHANLNRLPTARSIAWFLTFQSVQSFFWMFLFAFAAILVRQML